MTAVHEPSREASLPARVSVDARSIGFALAFEAGDALLRLSDREIAPGLFIVKMDFEVPGLHFPLDVTGGADRFQSQRLRLRALHLRLDLHTVAIQVIDRAAHLGLQVKRLRGEQGALVVEGRVGEHGGVSFVAHLSLVPQTGLVMQLRCVHALSLAAQGPTPTRLSEGLVGVLPLPWIDEGAIGVREIDLVEVLIQPLLTEHGWKRAAVADVDVDRVEINGDHVDFYAAGESASSWYPAQPEHVSSPFERLAARTIEAEPVLCELRRSLYDGDVDRAAALARELADKHGDDPLVLAPVVEALASHADGRGEAQELLERGRELGQVLVMAAGLPLLEECAPRAELLIEIARGAHQAGLITLARRAAVAAAELGMQGGEAALAREQALWALQIGGDDVAALKTAFDATRALHLPAEAIAIGERGLRVRGGHDPELAAQLGELYLQTDEAEKARRHFRRALRRGPRSDALLGLAHVATHRGDPARAVSLLAAAAEAADAEGDAQRHRQALVLRATFLLDTLGDAAGALRCVHTLLQNPSAPVDAVLIAARAADQMEEGAAALALFARVLDSSENPQQQAYAAYRLGMLHFERDETETAEQRLAQALALCREVQQEGRDEPSVPETDIASKAAQALLESRARRGDHQASAELALQSIASANGSDERSQAHLDAARAFLALQRSEASLQHLVDAIEQNPRCELSTEQLSPFIEACSVERLRWLVQRTSRLPASPSQILILSLVAQAFMGLGDLESADQALERALKGHADVGILRQRVEVARLRGEHGTLAAVLGQIAQIDHGELGLAALIEQAQLQSQVLAQPQRAVEALRDALKRGADRTLLLELAEAQLAASDASSALATLDAARQENKPVQLAAARRLRDLYLELGEPQQAIDAARAAESLGEAQDRQAVDVLLEKFGEYDLLGQRLEQRDDVSAHWRALQLSLDVQGDPDRALQLAAGAKRFGVDHANRVAAWLFEHFAEGADTHAVAALQLAIEMGSDEMVAEVWRLQLAQRLGERPECQAQAAELRQQLIEAGHSHRWLWAAQRDYLRGESKWVAALKLAAALSDRAEEADPIRAQDLDDHRQAAQIAALAGMDAQASTYYQRLVDVAAEQQASLGVDFTPDLLALAEIDERSGHYEDLSRTLTRAALHVEDQAQIIDLFRRIAEVEEHRLARPQQAVAALECVLRADPEDEGAVRALSKLYEFLGETDKLVALHCERAGAAVAAPQRAALLIAAGDVLSETDVSAALRLYHEAIDVAPESEAALEHLARLSRKRGLHATLVRALLHAARVRQGDKAARLYEEAGAILAGVLPRPRLATTVLCRSLERDPTQATTALALIEVARANPRLDSAQEVLDRVVRLVSLPADVRKEAQLARADLCALIEGDSPELRSLYRDVLKQDPGNIRALDALIVLSREDADSSDLVELLLQRSQAGDVGDSPRLLTFASELSERAPEAARRLVESALKMLTVQAPWLRQALQVARRLADDPLTARINQRLLHQESDLSPSERVSILREQARIAEGALEDREASIEALQQLLDIEAEDVSAQLNLGVLLAHAERFEEAARHLQFALEHLDPATQREPWMRAALQQIQCAEALGDDDQAARLLGRICELEPTARAERLRLADICERLEQPDRAARALNEAADLIEAERDQIFARRRAAALFERAQNPIAAGSIYLALLKTLPDDEELWQGAERCAAQSQDGSSRLALDRLTEHLQPQRPQRDQRLLRLLGHAIEQAWDDEVSSLCDYLVTEESSCAVLQQAVQLLPEDAWLASHKALLTRLLEQADPDDAARRAWYLRRAQVFADLGDDEAELRDLRAARTFGAMDRGPELRLIELSERRGDLSLAAEIAGELLLDPSLEPAPSDLFERWFAWSGAEGALQQPAILQRWIDSRPEEVTPRLLMAQVLHRQQQWAAIRELLDAGLDHWGDEGQQIEHARMLYQASAYLQDWPRAGAEVRVYLSLQPDDLQAQKAQGDICQHLGEHAQAAEAFERARELAEQQASPPEQQRQLTQQAADNWQHAGQLTRAVQSRVREARLAGQLQTWEQVWQLALQAADYGALLEAHSALAEHDAEPDARISRELHLLRLAQPAGQEQACEQHVRNVMGMAPKRECLQDMLDVLLSWQDPALRCRLLQIVLQGEELDPQVLQSARLQRVRDLVEFDHAVEAGDELLRVYQQAQETISVDTEIMRAVIAALELPHAAEHLIGWMQVASEADWPGLLQSWQGLRDQIDADRVDRGDALWLQRDAQALEPRWRRAQRLLDNDHVEPALDDMQWLLEHAQGAPWIEACEDRLVDLWDRHDRYEISLRACQRALERHGDGAELCRVEAALLGKLGRHEEQVVSLRCLAQLELAQGHTEAAQVCLEQLMDRPEVQAEDLETLADLRVERGDNEGAARALETLLQHDFDSTVVARSVPRILDLQGPIDPTQEIDLLQRWSQADPHSVTPLWRQALLLAALARWSEVETLAVRIDTSQLSEAQRLELQDLRTQAALQCNDTQRARVLLESKLEQNSESVDTWRQLGDVCARADDLASAAPAWLRAANLLELRPGPQEEPRALRQQAYQAWLSEGRLSQALDLGIKRAQRTPPEMDWRDLVALAQRSQDADLQQRLALAIEDSQADVEDRPARLGALLQRSLQEQDAGAAVRWAEALAAEEQGAEILLTHIAGDASSLGDDLRQRFLEPALAHVDKQHVAYQDWLLLLVAQLTQQDQAEHAVQLLSAWVDRGGDAAAFAALSELMLELGQNHKLAQRARDRALQQVSAEEALPLLEMWWRHRSEIAVGGDEDALRRWLDLDAGSRDALKGLVELLCDQQRSDEALPSLWKLAEGADPNLAQWALWRIAEVGQELRQPEWVDRALTRLQSATVIDRVAQDLWVEALLDLERYEDAALHLQQMGEQGDDAQQAEIDLRRAADLWRDSTNQPQQALAIYQNLYQHNPGARDLMAATVELLETCGQHEALAETLFAAAGRVGGLERRELLKRAAEVYEQDCLDIEAALVVVDLLLEEDNEREQWVPWRMRLLRKTGDQQALGQQLLAALRHGSVEDRRAAAVELVELARGQHLALEDAAEALQSALIEDPRDAELADLAMQLVEQGADAQMLEEVATAAVSMGDDRTAARWWLRAAQHFGACGQPRRAFELRQMAACHDASQVKLVDHVVLGLEQQGRRAEAAALLSDSLVHRDASQARVMRLQAAVLAARDIGDRGEVISALESIAGARPDARAWAEVGLAALAAGQQDRALRALGQARRSPDSAQAAGHLTAIEKSLLCLGQLSAAPEVQPSGVVSSMLTLAWLEGHQDYERALQLIERELQQHPQDPALQRRAVALALGPLADLHRARSLITAAVDNSEGPRQSLWLLRRAELQLDLDAQSDVGADLLQAVHVSGGQAAIFARARDLAAVAAHAETLVALYVARSEQAVDDEERVRLQFRALQAASESGEDARVIEIGTALLAASSPHRRELAERLYGAAVQLGDIAQQRRAVEVLCQIQPDSADLQLCRLALAWIAGDDEALQSGLERWGTHDEATETALLWLRWDWAQQREDLQDAVRCGQQLLTRGHSGAQVRDPLRAQFEGWVRQLMRQNPDAILAQIEQGLELDLVRDAFLNELGRWARDQDERRVGDQILRWRVARSAQGLSVQELVRVALEQSREDAERERLLDLAVQREPSCVEAHRLLRDREDPQLAMQHALAAFALSGDEDDLLHLGRLNTDNDALSRGIALLQSCRGVRPPAQISAAELALQRILNHIQLGGAPIHLFRDAAGFLLEAGQPQRAWVLALQGLQSLGRWASTHQAVAAELTEQALLAWPRDLSSRAFACALSRPLFSAEGVSKPSVQQLTRRALVAPQAGQRAAAWWSLAQKHHAHSRFDAAVAAGEIAYSLAPGAESRHRVQQLYVDCQRYARLCQAYEYEAGVTEDVAARASLHFNLANIYLEHLDRAAPARRHLRLAAKLSPDDVFVLRARVDVERRYGIAEALADALADLARVSPASRAASLFYEAAEGLVGRAPERAIALLSQAVQKNNRHLNALMTLADLHEKTGELSRARQHLERAAELSVEGEPVQRIWLRIAQICTRLGDVRCTLDAYLAAAEAGSTLALASAEQAARSLDDMAVLQEILGKRALTSQDAAVRRDLLIERSQILAQLEHNKQAHLIIEQLLRDMPFDPRVAWSAAVFFQRTRHHDAAAAELERLLTGKAGHLDAALAVRVKRQLMGLYAAHDGLGRAAELARELVVHEPRAEDARAILEASARQAKDHSGLLRLLRQRLDFTAADPARARIHLEIAHLLAGPLQKRDEALGILRALSEQETGIHPAGLALMDVLDPQDDQLEVAALARRLVEALPEHADWPRWMMHVAQAARVEQGRDAAVRVLQKLVRTRPEFAPAYLELWSLIGDSLQKGMFTFVAASGRRHVKDPELRIRLGLIESALRVEASDEDRALEILAEILQQTPGHGETLRRFMDLAGHRGKYSQVVQAIQAALDVIQDPDERMILLQHMANLQQGELLDEVAASATLRQALHIAPGNAALIDQLAQLRLQAQDYSEAQALLARLPAAADDDERKRRLLQVAECQRALGEGEGYVDSLRQVLRLAPDHVETIEALATWFADSDRLNEAIELIQQARDRGLRFDDRAERLWRRREADLLSSRGMAGDAIQAYWRAHELTPEDPQVLESLASLLRQQGEPAQLAEVLRRLAPMRSGSDEQVDLYLQAAQVLKDAGDLSGARRIYAQALDVEPKSAQALQGAAEASLWLTDGKRFADYGQRLLDVQPDFQGDAAMHAALGEVLQQAQAPAEQVLRQLKAVLALAPDDRTVQLKALKLARDVHDAHAVVQLQETLLEEADSAQEVLQRSAEAGRLARDILADRPRAIGLLYRAHAADPTDIGLKRELASLYMAEPATRREAIAALRQLVLDSPGEAQNYMDLAQQYRESGEVAVAGIVADLGSWVAGGAVSLPERPRASVQHPLSLDELVTPQWPRATHAWVRALTPVLAAVLESSDLDPLVPIDLVEGDALRSLAQLEAVDRLIAGVAIKLYGHIDTGLVTRMGESAAMLGVDLLERGEAAVRVALADAAAQLRLQTYLARVGGDDDLYALLALAHNALVPSASMRVDGDILQRYGQRLNTIITPARREVAMRALRKINTLPNPAQVEEWRREALQLTARVVLCASGLPLQALAVLLQQDAAELCDWDRDRRQAALGRREVQVFVEYAIDKKMVLLAQAEGEARD